ncbi:G-protein coupled receptor 98 [Clarias magur]|uniref:G-protein coupled receptor 98 n=1 Tax=Clarias magur TaxID=1594786 RepID=A0A8J4TMW7_CLAMG|nr:G-protein coupled receptor 98 [Clarias magur]
MGYYLIPRLPASSLTWVSQLPYALKRDPLQHRGNLVDTAGARLERNFRKQDSLSSSSSSSMSVSVSSKSGSPSMLASSVALLGFS